MALVQRLRVLPHDGGCAAAAAEQEDDTEGNVMRDATVIEKANGNYSAYVPDLPGRVATGETSAAIESEIREVVRFRIDGLKEDAYRRPS